MLHPQGNFYPQGAFSPQSFQNPPQGSVYPQGTFGQQGYFGQQALQSNPFQNNLGNIPFANTPYGYQQQTPNFAQGLPQSPNWQHPAQQAALQQHAIQQLLAHQLAAQQLGTQQPFGTQLQGFGQPSAMSAGPGLPNGASQSLSAWTQTQSNSDPMNPASPRHHLLQQLAQYHYLIAQQLAQLAAQQAAQGSITPYAGQFIPGAGQFIPGQLGGNFAPGITMH
jgi:hypothetical protein